MTNSQLWSLVIVTALITALLRTTPLFIKIPENNKIINKFFEALPYAVLTLLVFPGVFTSAGTRAVDIIKVLIGIVVIVIMTLRKYGLGLIIVVSILIIFAFDLLLLLL